MNQQTVYKELYSQTLSVPGGHPILKTIVREPFKEHLLRASAIAFLQNNNSIYVDIGANIGDTAALVLEAAGPRPMVLVEASEFFFDYLQQNFGAVQDVALINKFASPNSPLAEIEGVLAHWGGTAQFVISADSIIGIGQQVDLLSLLAENTGLVKLDCDGMDIACLQTLFPRMTFFSGPFLFECLITTSDDLERLIQLMILFSGIGYDKVIICHHSGALLFGGVISAAAYDVFRYQLNFRTQGNSHLCYYTDVLIVSDQDSLQFDKALNLIREWQEPQSPDGQWRELSH